MHKITVTEDCILTVVLNGAGGGNGGADAYPGTIGSPGDKVTCTISALKNDIFYIATGSSGGNGNGGGPSASKAGGLAGQSLNGFSGGRGGNAGPGGWSGSGGGGGGATVLYKYTNEGPQYIAIAAGGAGGGGGGRYSSGIPFQPVSRISAFYELYYSRTDSPGSWSSTLRNNTVRSGDGTYTLTYDLWSETTQNCTLYSSADDQASIYVNDVYIGASASYTSTSTHAITLNAGFNKLSFTVVNSGGGPTGYGAYILNSSGSVIWNTRYPYNQFDHAYLAGRGGAGQDHRGDGAGAGGGGGGFIGGAGGKAPGGDSGAESGYPGVSYAMSIAEFNRAAKILKDQWEPLDTYSINILGGSPRNTNGSFSVSSISSNIKIRSGNSFKSAYEINYKTSSGWTPVNAVYVRQNNAWVPLFAANTFVVEEVNDLPENSTSGYMVPYDVELSYIKYGGNGGASIFTGGVAVSDKNGGQISSINGLALAQTISAGGGGGKIICTAMNKAYGFGSYRNAVWLEYSEKHMTKAHEVGYHTLFMPLVEYAFYSGDSLAKKTVRKILEHGTRHRTADLRAEMHGRKRHKLGRFYRTIFEPLCYLVGKIKGY